MVDFISEIRERRVLPALGVYIGGTWVLIEILDRLVERYLLSPYLTDMAFWGLYSLIPAVILVAWTHGQPGKDEITTAEKVGLPINIIATIGLIMTMFSDKDLGAAAELVTMSDEHGQTVSQYVAGQSHRRKMAIFFWDNQTGKPENDWLSYAVPQMVTQDLQQSPFVQATSVWSGGPNGFYLQIRQAGFNDGLNIPNSLMRRIADEANRDYYVEGDITRAGEDWVLTARVWNSQTATLVGSVEERGADIYDLGDRISLGVRDVLEAPTGGAVEDLSIADTFGESEQALRSFVEGLNVWLFENDLEGAQELMSEALENDNQFVLAWFYKAQLSAFQGDLGQAQIAFTEAQKLDYRLAALDRMIVKANLYRIAGETEKLESLLRMYVRVSDDVRSRIILANVLLNSGQLEEARAYYQEILELDPSEIGRLLNLAGIERALGEYEKAINSVKEFLEQKPEDINAILLLGDMYRETGNYDEAATAYEQAMFVSTGNIRPLVRLSQLASSRGDTEEALNLLNEAAETANTPNQHSAILHARIQHLHRVGQIRKALETLEKKAAQDREFLPPVAVALGTTPESVLLYLKIDQVDKAWEAQAAGMSALEPPMNQFLAFNEALILQHEGDSEAALAAVERGVQVIEQFELSALDFQVSLSLANIASGQADHSKAAMYFEKSLQQIGKAISTTTIDGLPELMYLRPNVLAWLASEQVRAGELDAAQGSIEHGFKIDASHPLLWMARAELQLARGEIDLADASLGFTLAIWKNADPDYENLRRAHDLRDEIQSRL